MAKTKTKLGGFSPQANYNDRATAASQMDVGIKSPPGNCLYCFQIHSRTYHLVSELYPNEANKSGYRRPYIWDSAEGTTKRLKNKSSQLCVTQIVGQLDETLRQVHLLAESHKRMNRMKRYVLVYA
jgi:hypothetical protein